MKKLLATLAISASLLATSTTAQEAPVTPQMLPMITPCGPSQPLFDMLAGEKYNETPIALGTGTIYTPSGQPVNGQLTLWHNPNPQGKKNFSVVITVNGTDISCVLSSGIQLQLIEAVWGDPV